MQTGRSLIPGPDRFGALLFFLLAAFLVSGRNDEVFATFSGTVANLLALGAGFTATGLLADRRRLISLVVIGVAGMVLVVVVDAGSVWFGVGALGQAIVLGAVLAAVVRRVLTHDEVSLPTLLGVISAYVLIGMIFAWLYLVIAGFRSGPVLDPPIEELPTYYSFVVLSTLGFGDVTPVDEVARRVTAFEAVMGQVFLATVVARFVSLYGKARPAP